MTKTLNSPENAGRTEAKPIAVFSMGLGVEEEPPAWVCAIRAVLMLLLVPLIPVALIAYAMALAHRQYHIRWHELQDICLPFATIACVPFSTQFGTYLY